MRWILIASVFVASFSFATSLLGQRLTIEERTQMHQFVKQGKLQEAVEVAQGHFSVQELQRSRIYLAKEKDGNFEEVAREMEIYLSNFPMGRFSSWNMYTEVAIEYAGVLEELGRTTPGSVDLENVRAVAHFNKLMRSLKGAQATSVSMLDDMLSECPRSWLMVTAIYHVASRDLKGNRETIVDECVRRVMKQQPSDRIRVLLQLMQTHLNLRPKFTAEALYQVSQLSKFSWEKQQSLLAAAKSFSSVRGESDSHKRSVELFEEYFAKCPSGRQTGWAKASFARALFQLHPLDEVLARIKKLEGEDPKTKHAEPYFTLAKMLARSKRYSKALEQLEHVRASFSDPLDHAKAWYESAELLTLLNRSHESLAAHRSALEVWQQQSRRLETIERELETMKTRFENSPAQERYEATRELSANREYEFHVKIEMKESCMPAFRAVGESLLKEGKFEESLDIWNQWLMTQGCGLHHGHFETEKAYKIALCQAHLGRFDRAIATIDNWLPGGNVKWGARNRNLLFALTLFEQADQLTEFEGYIGKKADEFVQRRREKYDYMKTYSDAKILENSSYEFLLATAKSMREKTVDLADLQAKFTQPSIEPADYYAYWDWERPAKGSLKLASEK